MKKCVVLFFEGDTEAEFYRKLLEQIRKDNSGKKFNVKIEKKCIGGITKFENKLLLKYKNEIKNKYENYQIIVFLCHDTDVFVLNPYPPVDWDKIEKELFNLGANSIYHIKAHYSIEDFFLKDLDGLCNFLKIKPPGKLVGNNGVERICWLFKKGDRIYNKGSRTNDFLNYLDYKKISSEIKDEIQSLVDNLY